MNECLTNGPSCGVPILRGVCQRCIDICNKITVKSKKASEFEKREFIKSIEYLEDEFFYKFIDQHRHEIFDKLSDKTLEEWGVQASHEFRTMLDKKVFGFVSYKVIDALELD